MGPVIIVGAGPVGLALSLLLARHGVPSVVLDRSDGGRIEPRAARSCVLRPDAAELAARLGCASAAASTVRWEAWRTLRGRKLLERIQFHPATGAGAEGDTPGPDPDPDSSGGERGSEAGTAAGARFRPGTAAGAPYASPLHLAQHTLQRELRAAAEHENLVELVTGTWLETVEQDAAGITVRAGGPNGSVWRGSYLVGCDGARSTVRKLIGVRFPGRTATERRAVAALRAELPWPGEALLHWEPPWWGRDQRSNEVTARPLQGGLWRLDWLLPARGDLVTPETLVSLIRQTLAGWSEGQVPAYDLIDTGVHTCHQRLARHWRVGRAFLAGDAAHLLGALGTQSVDEGLRDVDNLAWKLAVACHDGASEMLLDSYEAERRGAIGARLRALDHAMPLVRGGGRLNSLLRGGGRGRLTLLRDGYLGHGPLGAPAAYGRSPLAAPDGTATTAVGTAPGAPVRDVPVIALNGTRKRLRELLGQGLLVLLVAPGAGVWESRHWLSAGLMPRLAAMVAALPLRSQLLVTDDYPATAPHTVLLIRPDGHLAAALPAGDTAGLQACAEAISGAESPAATAQPTAHR